MRDRTLWPLALAGIAALLLGGATDAFWSDFGTEALPAFEALARGDLRGFAALSPSYAGSLVLRAPFAAPAGWLGGGELALMRAGAVPALLALAALGVHLARRARAQGATRTAVLLTLGLAATSPMALTALRFGHPEDLLAAPLAVAAVLAALERRPNLTAVLLGLAVAAKPWAVLAALPALALLRDPRTAVTVAALAAAITAAVLAPILALDPGHFSDPAKAAVTSGALFHPHQVWWPFGLPATPEHLAAGHGERMSPPWLSLVSHPLIVLAGAALAALWRARGLHRRAPESALALLALAFLLRCALDPWNLVYYHLPLVLALLAWETATRRELPVVTLAATAAAYASFEVYDARTGTGPFLTYLAWALPLAAFLAHHALGAGAARRYAGASCPAAPTSAATPSSPSTSPA